MADDEKSKKAKWKQKKGEPERPEKARTKMKGPEKEDFKYIVRLAETDLDGYKNVEIALTKIRGFGRRAAIVLVDQVGIPRTTRIGDLDDDKITALSEGIADFTDSVPEWMVNRQLDVDTGVSIHIYASELMTFFRDDINRLKKIRCYRGIRHEKGKKVRGQRTRSNGRKGLTLGVMKGKGGPQAKKPTGTGPKKKGKGGKGGKGGKKK